ncbi:hypothetical protein QVD17_20282 [Tagetes erecta]|uniref:CCR4-NOT transcription complex subunit 1 n=1 Tax=Tagetes erecta TaxID=13708 RepID=A0AAD8KPC4_TARER|nr:hypothetical protein QVD17_20282 [Tagetes erecta]
MDQPSEAERIVIEVRNVLHSLNEHNYDAVVHDLCKYFDKGPEVCMLVVTTCLAHFNVYEDELERKTLEPAIASLFRNLMQKPHFSVTFSGLMTNRLISEDFLSNLSTSLRLSACEKVGFGLALLDSEHNDVKNAGRNLCMSQCVALCHIHDTLDTVAADVLDVLRFLDQSEVLSKHADSFKLMMLQVWLNANSHFILADQAHNSKLLSQIDIHIADPTETPNETCASLFAKMLGMPHFRAWNQLSYRCGELRAEGFQLRADVTFSLLMSSYKNTCQAPFPVDAVCGNLWENSESQLLFLKHALTSKPELFTFAHSKRQLEYVDDKFQVDHTSQPWLCVDLLEVLCQLAEKGYANSVWSMMEFPLNKFPEVLLLGMAHTPYNLLQHEVSKSVLPMLLKDSSKSGIILGLWHVNPLLLSRALNDSISLDPENIYRVVDLFQELQILFSVLDLVPMSLGIKMAAIASRKEFLDLVEWLTTNLSACEDTFFEECLCFVKEVENSSGENTRIYKHTIPTFSKVLALHTELLASTKLSEQMESLYVTCMQDSPETENINDPDSTTSESYADHLNTKMHTSSPPFTATTPGKVSVTSPMFGSPISINTLLVASANRDATIEVPSSDIQDTIFFWMNNLSAANIEANTKEFITALLAERYYPWFAQYLVMKRAAIEPNFHDLYINFLEQTGSKQLNKEIVEASYENCKVLLKSDLIKSSVEERKLLKNLGSWLGKLTVGRNQPLLAKHIDPKLLITEAYEKGLMIGVIPFISKILELCQSSVAYQPPNPWTMAILGLLVEIHAMPNLKANLTFEIEVLFKNLKVDMKGVNPTSLLKDKVRITEGNPDFSERKIVQEVKSTDRHMNQVKLPAEAAGPSYQGGTSRIVYQPPVPASTIPEPQSSFLDEHVLRMLPMAMNKAVDELASTVVQRSVSLASETAVELTLKEYNDESDEESIRSASSVMVVYLGGSLSSVTCKEPLQDLTETHLRNSAKGFNIAGPYFEDSMKRVINANLHLGYVAIQKNATEQGLEIVKRELTQRLLTRKKQKEASKSFVSKTAEPKNQKEAFMSFVSKTTEPKKQTEASKIFVSKTIEPSYTADIAWDKFQLEDLFANDATEVQIQYVTAEVHAIILKCIRRDEVALAMAQMVFEGLYGCEFNTAYVSSRLTILAAIYDVNELVRKELTSWVLDSDDRKFNKEVTVGLIQRRLLNLAQYSFHMARLINAGKSRTAIEFSISLVKTLETSDARVLSELSLVTDALAKVTYNHPVARHVDYYVSESPKPDSLGEQVSVMLVDWCRMHNIPGVSDANRAYFVQEVYRTVLSISDDMPNRFFYSLLDLVISHYRSVEINSSTQQLHQQDYTSPFPAIDIYKNIVFSILKFYPVNDDSYKLSLWQKVLSEIVGFVIKDANETKASFDSKPYFRLFSMFLSHLNTNSVIENSDFQVLTAISYAFHALQPANVPQFCFAWAELVTHNDFMPKLLTEDNRKGWPLLYCLLIDFLRFVEPLLRGGDLSTVPVRLLYVETHKTLMLLGHNFPEFVCYYHVSILQLLPLQCAELRNLVLDTLPPNLKVQN